MIQGVRVDPARFDPRRLQCENYFGYCYSRSIVDFAGFRMMRWQKAANIKKKKQKKGKRNNFINSKSKQKRKKLFEKKVIRKKDGL
jgi:hypothetical protein